MNQLNSVILEGNLVRDPVMSEPVEGFKVCRFTIGVNRFYKNKKDESVEEVSYFDVECFNAAAEYCTKKAKKGRGVRVVGRLKQDTWKDEEGKLKSKIYIAAEHIEYKPVFQKNNEAESAEITAETVSEQTAESVPAEVPVEETVF